MLKATLGEADDSKIRFVQNEKIGIQDGCYGVWEDYKGQMVFSPLGNAVYVSAIYSDINTGHKTMKLNFVDSAGRRNDLDFPRGDLTETGVLSLASLGVQVTKQTAKTLIWSIQNQEPEAEQYLYHKKLGFIEYNGRKVFLGAEGIGVDSIYTGGLSIKAHGTYEEWISMVQSEVIGNTPLELILAVGVSGLFVDFLKDDISLENIIVHCINESSTGKTTAALLAVSCGGSPSFKGDGLVYSFADTQNALIASFNSSFPALIDEGSLCRWNPTNFLYNLAMGKEKRRLSKELELTDSAYFRTAIIVTSEKSLLNMCDENSGLLVRNIEFEGVQWTKNAASADKIKSVIQTNYGFLVPMVVERLLEIEQNGSKQQLLDSYWNWCETIVEDAKAGGTYNPLTERAAKQSAVILLASDFLVKELDIPLNIDGILQMLEKYSMVSDPDAVDIGARAHEYLMQYVNTYYSSFISEEVEMTTRECLGRIKSTLPYELKDGRTSSRLLLITQVQFQKILKQGGFMDKSIVLKRLKALDLLKAEQDRYLSDIVIQDGIRAKGYMIRIPDMLKKSEHHPVQAYSSKKISSGEFSVVEDSPFDEKEKKHENKNK